MRTDQSQKMNLITNCVMWAMTTSWHSHPIHRCSAPDNDAWHKRHCSDGHQKPPSSVCHGRMKACPATKTRWTSSPDTIKNNSGIWRVGLGVSFSLYLAVGHSWEIGRHLKSSIPADPTASFAHHPLKHLKKLLSEAGLRWHPSRQMTRIPTSKGLTMV